MTHKETIKAMIEELKQEQNKLTKEAEQWRLTNRRHTDMLNKMAEYPQLYTDQEFIHAEAQEFHSWKEWVNRDDKIDNIEQALELLTKAKELIEG